MLEVLIVIAIAAVVFAFAMPYGLRFYRGQLVEETRANITDALRRARQSAVLQKDDSNFGVNFASSTGNYVLYEGANYSTRVTALDEIYPLVSGLVLGGIGDVNFAKKTGSPSATGTISVTFDVMTKNITITDFGASNNE